MELAIDASDSERVRERALGAPARRPGNSRRAMKTEEKVSGNLSFRAGRLATRRGLRAYLKARQSPLTSTVSE